MKSLIKRLFLNYYAVFILLFVSIVFILPYFKPGYILSFGESSIYIHPSYFNYFSMWEDKVNFGIMSVHQSNIFLFSVFWGVISLFKNFIDPSIIFIFVAYFLSGVTLYICLDGLLKYKYKYIYLPACLMYMFNVYRTIVDINERVLLLLITLPLFLFLYHKLYETKKWKYVFGFVLLLFVHSSTGANLPVYLIPFILILFYLIVRFFTSKIYLNKVLLIQHLVILILAILLNTYWAGPTAIGLLGLFNKTNGGVDLWHSVTSGNLFDHFRFIGSWAWKSAHMGYMYYPFALNYDKFPLLFTTYFISILSFAYLIKPRKNFLSKFILFSTLGSLILLAGIKGPFGLINEAIDKYTPFFKLFREPFPKFTPIFILSIAFGLTMSIELILKYMKKFKIIFIIILSLMILVNAKPFFDGSAIPQKRWNHGNWSNLIRIPEAWVEAKNFLNKSNLDAHLFTSPYAEYGPSYNWIDGTTVVGGMTDFLLDDRVLRSWSIDQSDVGKALDQIFTKKMVNNFDLKKYLSLFNVRYVLHQNDVEWRYLDDGNKIMSPTESSKFFAFYKLKEIKKFGLYDEATLRNIMNDDDVDYRKNLLYTELLNKPQLVIYDLGTEYFVPHVYAPIQSIVTDKGIESLPDIVSSRSYKVGSAIYLKSQNLDKNLDLLKTTNKLPSISFDKVSQTEYRVNVHGMIDNFNLVLSEKFDNNWLAYISGKTLTLVDPARHMVANGFANSWFFDKNEILQTNNVVQNADGSIDFDILMKYGPQKYLNMALWMAFAIVSVSMVCWLYFSYKDI